MIHASLKAPYNLLLARWHPSAWTRQQLEIKRHMAPSQSHNSYLLPKRRECKTHRKRFPCRRFCYHQRLSIAGNCRMCLVEVGVQFSSLFNWILCVGKSTWDLQPYCKFLILAYSKTCISSTMIKAFQADPCNCQTYKSCV